MPRFYFHTEDGHALRDREGVSLPDVAAARQEAVRALGEILKERSEDFWSDGLLRMSVTDQAGLTLFVVEVSATDAPALS
ncbi:MAG: DUF6894 family protein [Phenylobacterium sp.]